MAKKVERLIKVLIVNKEKATFRAELFSVSPQLSIIKISEQTANEKKVKTVTKIPTVNKELMITPDLTGLSKEDLVKRIKAVADYVNKHGVAKALEQVGKEVVKGKKQDLPKITKPIKILKKMNPEEVKKAEDENVKILAANEKTEAEILKIKEANKNVQDVIISWTTRIEKDLEFKVTKSVKDTPGFEEVDQISTEIEYTYKKVENWNMYFKLRPRDFTKHVQNYLNK